MIDEMIFKMTSTDNNGDTAQDWNTCDDDYSADATAEVLNSEFSLYDYSNLSTALEDADTAFSFLKSTGLVCDNTEAAVGFVHLQLAAANDIVVAAGTTKTLSLWCVGFKRRLAPIRYPG